MWSTYFVGIAIFRLGVLENASVCMSSLGSIFEDTKIYILIPNSAVATVIIVWTFRL